MNEFWNLDPIYKGFEDPCFAADLEALKKTVAEFAAFAGDLASADPLEGLRQGICLNEKVQELAMKLAEYAQLRQSVNTRDPEAGSKLGQVMAIYSGYAAPAAPAPAARNTAAPANNGSTPQGGGFVQVDEEEMPF